jgi:hypothetical protein
LSTTRTRIPIIFYSITVYLDYKKNSESLKRKIVSDKTAGSIAECGIGFLDFFQLKSSEGRHDSVEGTEAILLRDQENQLCHKSQD